MIALPVQKDGLQDVRARRACAAAPQGAARRVRGRARRALLDAAGLLRQGAARALPCGRPGLQGGRLPGVLLLRQHHPDVRLPRQLQVQ